jgi:hypothetical protein
VGDASGPCLVAEKSYKKSENEGKWETSLGLEFMGLTGIDEARD